MKKINQDMLMSLLNISVEDYEGIIVATSILSEKPIEQVISEIFWDGVKYRNEKYMKEIESL